MLNARTLAQTPTKETSGSEPLGGASVATEGTNAAEPLRPVEAFQTREGVIVLSNRPAGDEAAPSGNSASEATVDRAVPAAQASPAPSAPSEARAPAVGAPLVARAEPVSSESSSAVVWIAIGAIAVAVAVLAWLLVRRKQRRTTAHYAALLAGSEPIAPAPEHVGPFARRGSAGAATPTPGASSSAARTPFPTSSPTATPFPRASSDEGSSPRSAPPPSGISAPPASERQWLSQRPPRSYKQPPS